ncbi:MAG: hypothetical protein V7784_04820 [Oceanospirillaceae bacterium]
MKLNIYTLFKINARGGNDILFALSGKDNLKGGKGDDLLQSNDGDDKHKGEAGQ